MEIAELKKLRWELIPNEFVILDLETSGLDSINDSILEIGAVHFVKSDFLKSGEVTTFQVFIKQDKPIPKEATAINGITDEMVADGDSELDALAKFFDFIGTKRLFAYNSKFDKSFLVQAIQRNNFKYLRPSFAISDIYALAKKYIHHLPNRKLATIAKSIGSNQDGAHRAVNDCVMALHVFLYLKNVEFEVKSDAAESVNLSIKELEKMNEYSNRHLDRDYSEELIKTVEPLSHHSRSIAESTPSEHSTLSKSKASQRESAQSYSFTFISILLIVSLAVTCTVLTYKLDAHTNNIKNCLSKLDKPIFPDSSKKITKDELQKTEQSVKNFSFNVNTCIN